MSFSQSAKSLPVSACWDTNNQREQGCVPSFTLEASTVFFGLTLAEKQPWAGIMLVSAFTYPCCTVIPLLTL